MKLKLLSILLFLLIWPSSLFSAVDFQISSMNLKLKIETFDSMVFAQADVFFKCLEKGDKVIYLNNKMKVLGLIMDGEPFLNWSRKGVTLSLKGVKAGSHKVSIRYVGQFPEEMVAKTAILIAKNQISMKEFLFWHPTIPFQVFKCRIELDVPARLTAVTNGKLVSRQKVTGREHSIWEMEKLRTGATIIAGQFTEEKLRLKDFTVAVYSQRIEKKQELLRSVAKLIEFYSVHFGYWPFKEVKIIEDPILPSNNGRGMNDIVLLASNTSDVVFSSDGKTASGFLAHEVGHLLWGTTVAGLLSSVDDMLSFMCLTEGMAHLSALWYLSSNNPDEFRRFVNTLKLHWKEFPPKAPYKMSEITANVPKMSSISKLGLFMWYVLNFCSAEQFSIVSKEMFKKFSWKVIDINDFLGMLCEKKKGLREEIFKWYESDSSELIPAGVKMNFLPGLE